MTKKQFIEEYSAINGITITEGERYVNSFIKLIYSALRQGDRVLLSGFGTFSVAHRASKLGVNPRTGERFTIQAYKTPKFKAGQAFKDAVKKQTN